MVSKITRRTPTKPDRRRSRRKRTPIKKVINASSIVISTINRSISTCQRRLLKLFTRLATLHTPSSRKNGFCRLKMTDQEIDTAAVLPFTGNFLPPPEFPGKKTIFLDLDETLIHSKAESADPPPEKYDFIVRPKIDGEILSFYVLKRPGVDELLEEMAQLFEIVIFTAGRKEYASLVLDRLDGKGVISHRLYRDSCMEIEGKYVKDLSGIGRDLKRAVIVDDNPGSYMLNRENAVPIKPFVDDLEDEELKKLMSFLEFADYFDDMREAVRAMPEFLAISGT